MKKEKNVLMDAVLLFFGFAVLAAFLLQPGGGVNLVYALMLLMLLALVMYARNAARMLDSAHADVEAKIRPYVNVRDVSGSYGIDGIKIMATVVNCGRAPGLVKVSRKEFTAGDRTVNQTGGMMMLFPGGEMRLHLELPHIPNLAEYAREDKVDVTFGLEYWSMGDREKRETYRTTQSFRPGSLVGGDMAFEIRECEAT